MATTNSARGPSRVSPAGLLTACALVLSLVGLLHRARSRGIEEDTLARVQRTGRIRLGIANEAPYGYFDTRSGRVTGEAPEVARAVLERLGVPEIAVVATEFRSLIPGLRAGRFDLIAAGMYITQERCREVAFSNPTYRIGEALLVRAGNPLALHAYTDVARHPRAVLGVVAGSVEVRYADRSGVPRSRLLQLKDPSAAVDALRAGHIDAYAGTALTVRRLLDKTRGDELAMASPFAQPVIEGREVWGYGAFAFRKRDERLKAAFDAQLARFVGSPEHLARVRPYGFTQDELPGGTRASDLCDGGAF